jgi:hypothetical protein
MQAEQLYTQNKVKLSKIPYGQVLVAHVFNPSTQDAEAGESLTLRPAWSLESFRTARATQRNSVSKTNKQTNKQTKAKQTNKTPPTPPPHESPQTPNQQPPAKTSKTKNNPPNFILPVTVDY